MKRGIKNFILKITGQVSHLKKTIKCKHVWYGNTYGGFYLFPDLLDKDSIVYSFGIGEDISFDNAVIQSHDSHVFGFDPTPKSINWIGNQKMHKKFHFYEYGISSKSEFVDFYLPKITEHVSGSIIMQENVDTMNKVNVEMKSLEDIASALGHQHIDVLKMDIEGSEYDVIDNILSTGISIHQILIEFHDRFFEDGKEKTKRAIKEMQRYGYEIFAVSDSLEEVSFIKKSVLEDCLKK